MRTVSIRVMVAAVALAAMAFVAGCGAKKPVFELPADGITRFPTGEVLQEGDVILARSYGLIGAMFANHSQEGGKYSHGAMVYKGDDGRMMMLNYRPTGMEMPSCTPEEFFTRYNRLALLRYNGDIDAARPPDYTGLDPNLRGKDALSATARYWLQKNAEKRIPPDYRLDHDEHTYMFCLELTSTVYRDCGLPDPFYKAKKANEDPLLITANKFFKSDVIEIRSPSSALDNPDFDTLSQWLRPEYDMREEALNEECMRIVVDDISNGYVPGKPNAMGRLKLRQIFAIYHIVTKVMFWRPKQDLPDYIDQEVIGNAYMLYNYVARSKKMAKKRMLEETTPVYADSPDREEVMEAVRQIVRQSTDCFRDRFMVRPSSLEPGVSPCGCVVVEEDVY